MARGGSRIGAGRKPGAINKATQQQRDAVAESGMTPLEYLLSVMRSEEQSEDARRDAAKAAAPYVHARLSSVDLNAKHMMVPHEEALGELE